MLSAGTTTMIFVDRFAAFELPERVNDYRNAAKLQELLGLVATQASSPAGGDHDRDIHSLAFGVVNARQGRRRTHFAQRPARSFAV